MKNLLCIYTIIIFMFGAVQQAIAERCNDKRIKNKVIELYINYYLEECNEILQYSDEILFLAGLDPRALKKICNNLKNGKFTIEHTITTNINKSVQKHYCQGIVKSADIEKRVSYSFQPTDDRKNLWIQIENIE